MLKNKPPTIRSLFGATTNDSTWGGSPTGAPTPAPNVAQEPLAGSNRVMPRDMELPSRLKAPPRATTGGNGPPPSGSQRQLAITLSSASGSVVCAWNPSVHWAPALATSSDHDAAANEAKNSER